jgi:hypothetical protein
MPVDPSVSPASPAPRSPDASGAPPAPLPALEQALAGLALAGEASCERRARRAADEWAAREQCGRNSGALAELRITWSTEAGECAEAAGEGGEPLPRLPAIWRGLADLSVSASAADGVDAMCSSNAAAEDALPLADLPSAALPAAVRGEADITIPGVRAARTFHAAAATADAAVAAPDDGLGDGGGESDDGDGAGGFDVQLVRRDARLRDHFEAELEQLNAARERRRREERSWRAQEEARQQTLAAQTQRLREALALALDRAAAHTDFVAAERERRWREARALRVRELSALHQRQAAALAQAREQQRAEAAEAVMAGAIDASASAATPLAEQVRQARLNECRCFAGGAEGHVPGCVGGAPVVEKDAKAVVGVGAGAGMDAGADAYKNVDTDRLTSGCSFPLTPSLCSAAASLPLIGFTGHSADDSSAGRSGR